MAILNPNIRLIILVILIHAYCANVSLAKISGSSESYSYWSDNRISSSSPSPKNFSTTLENTCSVLPKISIVSYSRDGFSPNDTFQSELIPFSDTGGNSSVLLQGTAVLSPYEAVIEIECEAGTPIQWTFEGPNVISCFFFAFSLKQLQNKLLPKNFWLIVDAFSNINNILYVKLDLKLRFRVCKF